tara:strand:+ start:25 stop:789 length:765 start_codon:yes stop_codon:yes gene_type:complete
MGSQVTSPGDLVDIQYMYDVFGDSIFAPTIDDTELKEGGIVNNYNSMDEIMKLLNGSANNFAEGGLAETESEASTVMPRRAGEYGRRYFTDPTYTATGLDVAGDALATGADAVNIPGYTFNRQLRADPNTPYVPSGTASGIAGLGETYDLAELYAGLYDAFRFSQGGYLGGQGYYLGGTTDGMADQVPATIDNNEPARLSHGEFVIPADAVAHFGNGNSEAGADFLTDMLSNIREDRTGNPNQGRQIDPNQYLA